MNQRQRPRKEKPFSCNAPGLILWLLHQDLRGQTLPICFHVAPEKLLGNRGTQLTRDTACSLSPRNTAFTGEKDGNRKLLSGSRSRKGHSLPACPSQGRQSRDHCICSVTHSIILTKTSGQTKPTEMVLGNLAEKKEWIATRTHRIGLASIVVIARGDRRQYKFNNNKSALKEILLHHQGDFLGLKGIILKLSNSVKKWKKRKDETDNLINGMIVKCKRYLKSKDNSLV